MIVQEESPCVPVPEYSGVSHRPASHDSPPLRLEPCAAASPSSLPIQGEHGRWLVSGLHTSASDSGRRVTTADGRLSACDANLSDRHTRSAHWLPSISGPLETGRTHRSRELSPRESSGDTSNLLSLNVSEYIFYT